MANQVLFATADYEKIQPAIDSGILTFPAFVFITSDDEYKNRFAFIDKNLDIQLVRGEEVSGGSAVTQVQRVDQLPEVEDASEDVLYIYDNIVYVFTGSGFKPMYVDYSEEVSDLTEKVSVMEETVENVSSKVDALDETVQSILSGSSGLVFSPYEDFPEVGVENQLYVDTTDNSTRGIYAYDDDSKSYKILSEGSGVTFIDLNDVTVAVVTVSSYEDLKDALADESITTINLDSDIEGQQYCVLFNTGGEKTLNLNGCSLTAEDVDDGLSCAIGVTAGCTLTVNADEDSIIDGGAVSSDSNVAVYAQGEGAKVILNGGTYNVSNLEGDLSNSTIYAADGATIEIYGGYYKNTCDVKDGGFVYVLNVKNNTDSHIICYGGSFLNQNPADGDDAEGGTFVADGYTVTSEEVDGGTLYTVVAE